MKPRLLRSALGDRVYIVTRYRQKVAPNGKPYIVASTKYEVSEQELSDAYLISIPPEDRDSDEFELTITRGPVAAVEIVSDE